MGGTRTIRTNLVLLLRQYFSEFSTQSPIYYEISLFWLLGTWPVYSQPVRVVGILQPASFQWFFPWPWRVFSWTCTDQFSVKIWGNFLQISGALFAALPLWYFALWILATLAFLNYQLCLLNSGRLPCSAWVPLPALQTGTIVKLTFVCFLSLRDYWAELPGVQCLKNIVLLILSSFLIM